MKTTKTDNQADAVRIVEEFIEHFYNGEYIIDEFALQILCGDDHGKLPLSHMLNQSLRNYLVAKKNVKTTIDQPEKQKIALAQEAEWLGNCLTWITCAWNARVVIEHESLTGKAKKLETRMCN